MKLKTSQIHWGHEQSTGHPENGMPLNWFSDELVCQQSPGMHLLSRFYQIFAKFRIQIFRVDWGTFPLFNHFNTLQPIAAQKHVKLKWFCLIVPNITAQLLHFLAEWRRLSSPLKVTSFFKRISFDFAFLWFHFFLKEDFAFFKI